MKKILLMSMLLLGVMVSFTSCSDDDDDNKDREMSKTVKSTNGKIEAVITAYFKNDICTSAKAVAKCDSEATAQKLYAAVNKLGTGATVNGANVIVDLSATLKEMSRQEVQQFFDGQVNQFVELLSAMLDGDEGDDDPGIKETENEMSMTVKAEMMEVQLIAYFEDNVCTGGNTVMKCANEYVAQMVYGALLQAGAPATIDGTTITIDLTEQLKGLSKAEVRVFFEEAVKEYQKQFAA